MERTERLRLRATPVEKAAIEQNAKRAGLTVSEFIRREACGELPASLRAPAQQRSTDALEQRVRELTRTMPRRNAELVAKRELARA